MSTQYRVRFDDGHYLYVYSADAKSLKRQDVRAAYTKARKKDRTKISQIQIKSSRY